MVTGDGDSGDLVSIQAVDGAYMNLELDSKQLCEKRSDLLRFI